MTHTHTQNPTLDRAKLRDAFQKLPAGLIANTIFDGGGSMIRVCCMLVCGLLCVCGRSHQQAQVASVVCLSIGPTDQS